MDDSQARELLGYPDGARLLIVNADDFGMSHSGNVATLQAFEEGILTSTTLMLPCPWAPHAMQMLRDHPDLPFGVHLTIVSEHDAMRWGPRAGRKNGLFVDRRRRLFLSQFAVRHTPRPGSH
ncbi:MAG: ChbG/HpnK family deacetylase [Thermomicrobiales bacterium]